MSITRTTHHVAFVLREGDLEGGGAGVPVPWAGSWTLRAAIIPSLRAALEVVPAGRWRQGTGRRRGEPRRARGRRLLVITVV